MNVQETMEDCYEVERALDGAAGARRFAARAVLCGHALCREAAVMAVTELAENMLKYADASGLVAGRICIETARGMLTISARNPVARVDDARPVTDAVAVIGRASDVEALYRARLADLFSTPTLPRAELGLVRIAFEGGFRLRAVYSPGVLEITAERPCAPR